jgi:hypothetical protein
MYISGHNIWSTFGPFPRLEIEAGNIGNEMDKSSHHSSFKLPASSAQALFSYYLDWKSVLSLVGQ